MDHFKNKHILSAFLFVLFSGTLFFIPAVFVSRFTTAPALWMQAGISFGMLGYVLLTKERILLPPKSFIILIAIWAVYHILGIIAVCLVVTVIALSQARAAVLATVIIFYLFFIRLLKERDIRLLPVHYTAVSLSCLLLFAGLFYVKKDSASGRLLIWECSGQLISRKPVAGDYEKSLQIARECEKLWTDYDLQMLVADNCLQIQDYKETEQHLKCATTMSPVKFMPLYQLVELYLETGQNEKARLLAQKILDKPVKVPSPIIDSIKSKMMKLLNDTKKHNDKKFK